MKSSPIAGKDRLVSIDIIRGFALFGIFLVNMPTFHSPVFLKTVYGIETELIGINYWIDVFFTLFVEAKFFTIFSFLFGLGFYIFMNRAEEKGLGVHSLYLRRIFALFLFGVVHLVGLWFGDILHTYAIAGIFLLFFYRRKMKTMIIWAVVLLSLIHLILGLTLAIPSEMLEEMTESSKVIYIEKAEEYVEVYENAGYIDWVTYRLGTEVTMMLANLVFAMIPVLAMFLIGLAAGKAGIFHDTSKHLPFLKKARLLTFLISLPIVFFLALLKLGIYDIGAPQPHAIQFLKSLSGVSMSLFYILALVNLLEKEKWRKRLNPLRFIGQMALSNYLFQTIICVALFVGLGFYGEVSLFTGTLICLMIFIGQMGISAYWLKKFRFGPFEWLWRTFTYWKLVKVKG